MKASAAAILASSPASASSPAWFNRNVRPLAAALESDPELDRRCYGAGWDLRAYRYELEYAERVGTRFYLAAG